MGRRPVPSPVTSRVQGAPRAMVVPGRGEVVNHEHHGTRRFASRSTAFPRRTHPDAPGQQGLTDGLGVDVQPGANPDER